MGSSKEFKDFLWLPYLCAKAIGLDPTEGRGTLRFKIQCVFIAVGVLNHVCIMICEVIFIFKNYADIGSLLEVTKLVSIVAYVINTNAKLVAVFADPALIRHVLSTTEALFPKTRRERHAFRVNEHFWPTSIYLLACLYMLCGWAFYIMPSAIELYKCLRFGEEFSYEPPFKVTTFFDYKTKLRFGLLYLSELWAGHMCVCSNLGTDLVLCCLIMQMCMHFRYIGREIEHFSATGQPGDCVFLVRLIERHHLILKLCLNLNEIFGKSLLFNLISSSGVICLSAFQVSAVGFGMEFIKYFLMLLNSMGQLFIVCYFGDELISCSKGIAVSIGTHAWYNGSASYKRMLVFFMLRCQKPVVITAMDYLPVSLESFQQVTSVSYRVFTLLHTFPNDEL